MQSKPNFRLLRPFLAHIAGENPSYASLCGSNVYVVGEQSSSERIMIDAGDLPSRNASFLQNLKAYLDNSKPNPVISKILLTHAHQDHVGGLQDIIKMLKDRGQSQVPLVYKHLDGNQWENKMFDMFEDIVPAGKKTAPNQIEIHNISEGQIFNFDSDENKDLEI